VESNGDPWQGWGVQKKLKKQHSHPALLRQRGGVKKKHTVGQVHATFTLLPREKGETGGGLR
jgi:hypothetical protein